MRVSHDLSTALPSTLSNPRHVLCILHPVVGHGAYPVAMHSQCQDYSHAEYISCPQDRWHRKAKSLKFPKTPAKLCLNGGLWTQFDGIIFRNFPEFLKKTISRGNLGQHRPEKSSSRSWIRCGAMYCSPHTSFDEIIDSVVNSERGELVRGSDPPLVHSAHSTAGNLMRASTRLLLKTHLEADV